MKKSVRFLVTFFAVASVIALSCFCFFIVATADATLDESKLVAKGFDAVFYDADGSEVVASDCFGRTDMSVENLPEYVKNAFVAVEDKRFFTHKGVDLRALARAAVSDIKSRSLKEGGSTISQQLVKNTHLSGEKTVMRKLKELKLALELEKKYSKTEILSFYLNGIYFGNGAYGIGKAAERYFSKKAEDLTLNEAASLAATVKAPSTYNPEAAGNAARKNLVLKLMREQGYISEAEYEENLGAAVVNASEKSDYFSLVKNELFSLCGVSPYETRQVKVYTYYDRKAQDALTSLSENDGNGGGHGGEHGGEICKNGLIASRFGKIKAAYFPLGDNPGMPASTIKPILVYAPAFNEGELSLATLIDDSPVDFGGYRPQNYGGKSYGQCSVKECISKSLNVPAVKVLDSLGAEKCLSYAKKAGVEINEKTLNIALGCYSPGIDFTDLCAAYTTFAAGGRYYPPRFIKNVRIGRLSVYSDEEEGVSVFKPGTAELITEALRECVKTGTAKALSGFDFELCAKTGTNGTKEGNTDALAICYTSEDVIGVKLCRTESGLMPCSVTGGTAAREAVEIIEKLYSRKKPADFEKSGECETERICKLAYEDGKILLAPENQPDKYCLSALFMKEFKPTEYSTAFTVPEIKEAKIEKNGNTVSVTIDKKTAVKCMIIRRDGNKETVVSDDADGTVCDKNLKDGRYCYYALPYVYDVNGETIRGEPVFIAEISVSEKKNFAENGNWADD